MRRDYSDPAYKNFRIAVLKRDKFRCQMPNCKCEKLLNVHHIKTWSKASSMRYDPNNGITLCKNCHNSINGKEHHYENLFKEIVDGKI